MGSDDYPSSLPDVKELKNIEKTGKFRTNPSDRRTYTAYLFLHVAIWSTKVLLFPQIAHISPRTHLYSWVEGTLYEIPC